MSVGTTSWGSGGLETARPTNVPIGRGAESDETPFQVGREIMLL